MCIFITVAGVRWELPVPATSVISLSYPLESGHQGEIRKDRGQPGTGTAVWGVVGQEVAGLEQV